MQITAKIIQLLPLQTGTGKNGEWKKQDLIVETEGQYPKKICLSVWGERIKEDILQVGKKFQFSVEIESQEFNGKWFTNVKAWKFDELSDSQNASRITNSVDNVNTATKEDTDMPF
jgi:hypothetical protein